MNENDDKQVIEMEITDYMAAQMKDVFDMELEMMKGEYRKLPNGMHFYKIELGGYKLKMFKDFMNMLISKPTDKITVKFMGLKINQN